MENYVYLLLLVPGLLLAVTVGVMYWKAARKDRESQLASEAFSEDLRRHNYMRG